MSVYQLLFGFEGRFGRAMFWGLGIPVGIVLWMALGIGQTAWTQWHAAPGLESLRLIGTGAAWQGASFVGLVAAVSSCAIAAKRLHDRNKSTAWLLLFYGVPALVWLAPCDRLDDMTAFLLGGADAVILLWQVVELGFMRGTIGTNDYGPDPLLADLHERRFADLHHVT